MTDAELRESFRKRRQQILAPGEADKPIVLDALSHEEIEQAGQIDRIVGVAASRAVAMRMLGFSTEEIASELRVEKPKVERWLMLARKKGALSDVGDRLEYHARALAVDKLIIMIENGDKDAILELLKGRGDLRTFSESKHDGRDAAPINLQVNVELPTGVQSIEDIAIHGQITGQAREISAEAGEDNDSA
jgi:hypothetical protein